jgi:dTDP-D-glucose 4,6-dehydratase
MENFLKLLIMKNKILITGGAGFIGSNLCEKLVKNPNNITYSLDNYSTDGKNNYVPNVTCVKGERALVVSAKTEALGLKPLRNIPDYINEFKKEHSL